MSLPPAVDSSRSSPSRTQHLRQNLRVMMLGWEYPPRLAGGLGKACQGLAQAMAKQGAQVFFVLPTFSERLTEPRLEVVGARECLLEAGWKLDLERMDEAAEPRVMTRAFVRGAPMDLGREAGPEAGQDVGGEAGRSATYRRAEIFMAPDGGAGRIEVIRSQAQLHPYGMAPEDPVPERLLNLIEKLRDSRSDSADPEMAQVSQDRRDALKRALLDERLLPEHGVRQVSDHRAESREIYGKNLWSEIEKFCFTVRHLAEAHEVDVIHAHDWMTFPAAFEFQRVTGVPVFLHVHATEYDRSGENLNNDVFRIEREGFRRATHIFAVSRYTAGIIERLYGVHRKKISVVYNAPENDLIEASAKEDVDVREDVVADEASLRRPDVVFLGRLTFQKGPDHFLNAANIAARAHPTARFMICGTGDMMDALKEQAKRLGIQDRVHFVGFVNPSEVDRILMRSKVLVMPSVSEPFGLVALEAVRCGIPVILSKQSGVREVLHRALQVDFWDVDKLADQMIAALRLPDLSRQLVEEGMEQIQNLSWAKSAAKVLHTYQRYVGRTFAQAIGGTHGH